MENKLDMKSKDIVKYNIEKISEIFPNCISEGKLDYDMLKQELSNDILEAENERYQLTWAGKRKAIINANSPCSKTLRPVKSKSIDFDNTKNIYIEGDNLDVLKILQESYLNKIKCIYIDPPYNTGKDFVYNDKFSKSTNEELKEAGRIDNDGNMLVSKDINNISNGKFHSDWLTMMYSRLKVARNLLKNDGCIFISIDDTEVDNLKKIGNEIFGEENFICQFVRKTGISARLDAKNVSVEQDYVLMFAKNSNELKINKMKLDNDDSYKGEDEFVKIRGKYKLNKLDRGSISYSASLDYPIESPDGTPIYPGGTSEHNAWCWRWSKEKVKWGIENKFIVFKKNNESWSVYFKQYQFVDNNLNKIDRSIPYKSLLIEGFNNEIGTKEIMSLFNRKVFDYPKPVALIKHLLNIGINDQDIVLDFFSGSATTANAVMRINAEKNSKNKYILVQLPEKVEIDNYDNICCIGQDRIRKAGTKIKEETNANIDYGFRVYRVDSSNMKDVYYAPTDLQQSQLNMFESNIKEDRTSEDLLTQVILDLGLTLDLSIEERKIFNNNVYFVENNSLVACFDETIDINIVDEICKCNPLKIVFKESSFKTDSDKINVFERIKKLSNDTEINII